MDDKVEVAVSLDATVIIQGRLFTIHTDRHGVFAVRETRLDGTFTLHRNEALAVIDILASYLEVSCLEARGG